MKNLQNNFTTPEQSKRLLELGVPDWTSDCVTSRYGGGTFLEQDRHVFRKCIDSDNYVPCWSVGRLIEIFIICTPFVEIRLRTRLVEQLIASYEDVIKQGLIDFSKLEC